MSPNCFPNRAFIVFYPPFMGTYRKLLWLFLTLALTGCATYQPSYKPEKKNHKFTDQSYPGHNYSIFLIGDAGGDEQKGQTEKTLALLEKRMSQSNTAKKIVFLGDNIYPDGMPHKDHKDREDAEFYLQRQLDAIKNFKDDVYFIPGNHDWIPGPKGLKRQQEAIDEFVGKKHGLFPKNGCGDPKIVELTDQIVLLLLDTQWWMMDWDDYKNFNRGCRIQSKADWIEEVGGYFSKYQEKHLIVACHHPIQSFGSHSGYLTAKDWVFPLTAFKPSWYLPLPFIGPLLRHNLGIRQDDTHPLYAELIHEILVKAKDRDHIIFASGHEHNLQLSTIEGHPQIVSGSGSKTTAAYRHGDAEFTYGKGGIAEIRFYDDESAEVLFYESETGKTLYRSWIVEASDPSIEFDFSEYQAHPSHKTLSIYDKDDYPSTFHRALWGKLNRSQYYKEVTVPCFLSRRSLRRFNTHQERWRQSNTFAQAPKR